MPPPAIALGRTASDNTRASTVAAPTTWIRTRLAARRRFGRRSWRLARVRRALALRSSERSSDSCHGSIRPRSRTASTNPPFEATGKPAELADGLALARYAALRRRFAPATTWIASGPPLTGHGWPGDSARYVPRHAITPS